MSVRFFLMMLATLALAEEASDPKIPVEDKAKIYELLAEFRENEATIYRLQNSQRDLRDKIKTSLENCGCSLQTVEGKTLLIKIPAPEKKEVKK